MNAHRANERGKIKRLLFTPITFPHNLRLELNQKNWTESELFYTLEDNIEPN